MLYSTAVYLKLHRRNKVLVGLFIFGFLFAFLGLKLQSYTEYQMNDRHAASAFYSPLIYISIYQILRMVAKKITGIEPAYQYASSYDNADNRKLKAWDYAIFVLPFLIAIFSPSIIEGIKN